MARAMTSAARASDAAASTIMSSFAHGFTGETSAGLKAVAVQKLNDRLSRNRGVHGWGTTEVCCISGKTNAGSRLDCLARAAAPPRSRSQYQSAKVMMLVNQIT